MTDPLAAVEKALVGLLVRSDPFRPGRGTDAELASRKEAVAALATLRSLRETHQLVPRDFGMHRETHDAGDGRTVELECRYVAPPGLTLHNLVEIFDKAEGEARPADRYAADPSKWPIVRGVSAVTKAIVDAMLSAAAKE